MLKLILMVIGFLFTCEFSYGQLPVYSGRIIDNYSQKPVVRATISIYGEVAQTDNEGFFSVSVNKANGAGSIRVSHISYNDTLIRINDPAKFILIRLERNYANLPEVIVPTFTTSVMQKVRAHLCENYPNFPVSTWGYHTAEERINEHDIIYFDTAVIKSYIYPYCNNRHSKKLEVLQNKFRRISLPDSKWQEFNVFFGGYYFIDQVDYLNSTERLNWLFDHLIFKQMPDSVNGEQRLIVINADMKTDEDDKRTTLGAQCTFYIDPTSFAITKMVYDFISDPGSNNSIAIEKEYGHHEIVYRKLEDNKYYFDRFETFNLRMETYKKKSAQYGWYKRSMKHNYQVFQVDKSKPENFKDQSKVLGPPTKKYTQFNKPLMHILWREAAQKVAEHTIDFN